MSSCSALPAISAVFLLVLGLSSGSVIPLAGRIDASQIRIQDELGQYHFAHVGGPNSREETRVADGSTRGSYSYVDGNGLIQSAAYVSDPVNGFRVAATNLPAGPAVPAGSPALVAPVLAPALLASAPAPLVLSGPAVASPAVIAKTSEPAPAGEAQNPEEPRPEEPRPEEPAPSTEPAPVSEEPSSTAAPENPSPAPVAPPSSEEAAPAPVNPFVPVQDTPEVIAARQQHLAAFQETQARDAASGTEDSSSGEPTETPETPEPTEPASSPAPAAESSSEQPQPPALIPAAVPAVHLAGHFPAVPVAPIAPVAAVAAPAIARVAAVAAPSVAAVALPAPAIALADAAQYRVQDELGQYAFGHAGGPNAREEIRTADGVTRGGYAYVDGNGLVQSANYLADSVNGFRVAATNLPVQPQPSYIPDSPEVAEAKAALLRAQQEHIAKL